MNENNIFKEISKDLITNKSIDEISKIIIFISNQSEINTKNHDKSWDLIKEIVSNLDQDPAGDLGIVIAARIMELMETLNSKVPKPIESIIWEKGFKAGKILSSMSPETLSWVDSAMDAYWHVAD